MTIDERSTRIAQELDAAATLNEPREPVIERHLREVATDQRAACGNAVIESYGRTKGAKVLGEVAYQAVMNTCTTCGGPTIPDAQGRYCPRCKFTVTPADKTLERCSSTGSQAQQPERHSMTTSYTECKCGHLNGDHEFPDHKTPCCYCSCDLFTAADLAPALPVRGGAPPMCRVHARLDQSGTLELTVGGNNCLACSLNEREALLELLAPFALADAPEDSLTVLRKIADFYATHVDENRVVVSYPGGPVHG